MSITSASGRTVVDVQMDERGAGSLTVMQDGHTIQSLNWAHEDSGKPDDTPASERVSAEPPEEAPAPEPEPTPESEAEPEPEAETEPETPSEEAAPV